MIKFKKGAFIGEASIKPVSSKYYGPLINPSGDVTNMVAHFVLVTCNPYMTLHLKEYPVFKPNEYFWKHYWNEKGGEQRWEAYARVIREIIADGHNFPLADLQMEDKLYYKKLLNSFVDTKTKI